MGPLVARGEQHDLFFFLHTAIRLFQGLCLGDGWERFESSPIPKTFAITSKIIEVQIYIYIYIYLFFSLSLYIYIFISNITIKMNDETNNTIYALGMCCRMRFFVDVSIN